VLDPVGLAQVLMETTSGQSKHYLPGLAQYDATNGWQYVTSDRVGSVRLLIKPNGEVALSQSFDPFGNVLGRTGVGQSSFGYTGEQTDPTGLVFLRARYYDPRVGRFLTADSVVPDPLRSQAWNRYAYVANNSVNSADPSGHCAPYCAFVGAYLIFRYVPREYLGMGSRFVAEQNIPVISPIAAKDVMAVDLAWQAVNGVDLAGNELDFQQRRWLAFESANYAGGALMDTLSLAMLARVGFLALRGIAQPCLAPSTRINTGAGNASTPQNTALYEAYKAELRRQM
jgi:RHS repeat-associated protein